MKHKVKVYPHNDLFNLAHYQREMILKKIAQGNNEALLLDCMSCLISLAFTVESLINFIGSKKVSNWRERQPFKDKITQVCKSVGLLFDKSKEPYSSLWDLKELRDSIAHGQSVEIETTAQTRNDLFDLLECPWDKNLTPDFVNQAYHTVKEFEKELYTKGNIQIGETLTSFESIR